MSWRPDVRRSATVALVVAAWCALWGEVSVANVASGLVVAGLAAATLGGTPRGGVRLVPLARLGWLVLVDLVTSTIAVAREVLTPGDGTDEGIIAVDLPPSSVRHHLLIVVAVTLTPGTAVVETDPRSGTVYVHLLHVDGRAAVTRHIEELAAVADRALPERTDAGGAAP